MKPVRRIKPRNLPAQLEYRGLGNPPSSHPQSAVANCFPGLETDFRNLWRRILCGIRLHEASNLVVAVEDNSDARLQVLSTGWMLISIMDTKVTAPVIGPTQLGGPSVPLSFKNDLEMPLEWSNALALLLSQYAGQKVRCRFEKIDDTQANPGQILEFDLMLRPVFEDGQAVISEELAAPGELSQSLCSPWMSDYRECYCFYWAANRPDFVNVETATDGTSIGHNWMRKDRKSGTPKVYIGDDPPKPELMTYADLYGDWEKLLSFVIGGKTEETVPAQQTGAKRRPSPGKERSLKAHADTNQRRGKARQRKKT